MKITRQTLGLAMVAVLATTLPASSSFADGKKHPVDVGVFGGWHIFSKTNGLGSYDIPDGAPDSFEDETTPASGPVFGLRIAYRLFNRLSIEGELGGVRSASRADDSDALLGLAWRGHLLFHLIDPDAKKLGFDVVLGGAGMSAAESDLGGLFEDTDTMVEGGLALRYRLTDSVGIRLDGRVFLPPAIDKDGLFGVTQDFEALLGVYKTFGLGGTPPPPPPEPEPTVGDADGDGVKDDVDGCKDDPEDLDGFEDTNGCPDPDNDGDGVGDAADECDDQMEDMDTYKDEDGCPDPDNDGDGMLDAADGCPIDAEDVDGFEDENGCPDPDNDQDGVLDAADRCPESKETHNGFEDDDGCTDEIPVAVQKFSGTIKGINFVTKKSEITKGSFSTLDAAAKVLIEYPSVRLEIQGHTDDVGNDDDNLVLSQARADAVKAYMVNAGIDDSRLTAVGYGETKPVIAKTTKAARAKNRRVEFQIITGGSDAAAAPAAPVVPEEPAPEGGN